MDDWRKAGPQIKKELARLAAFQQKTANLDRVSCLESIEKYLHGAEFFKVLRLPLNELRDILAEFLFMTDETKEQNNV